MNKQELHQVLDEIAAEAVPTNADVWPLLRERLPLPADRSARKRLIPAPRLAWLGFATAILFILSITAYSAGPWFSRLFEKDERLQQIDLSLIQHLDLSQTIENVTVTVEWAYADHDRVLVGYNIRTSDERRFDLHPESLTDQVGIELPQQGTYGVTGQSDILQLTLPPGEGTYVGIFDNISASRALKLRFAVHAEEFVQPATQASSSPAETSGTTAVLTTGPSGRIIGPFVFDFEISVAAPGESR